MNKFIIFVISFSWACTAIAKNNVLCLNRDSNNPQCQKISQERYDERIKIFVEDIIELRKQNGEEIFSRDRQESLNKAKKAMPFNVFKTEFTRCGETFNNYGGAESCLFRELQKIQEKFNKENLKGIKVNALCGAIDSAKRECSFVRQIEFDSWAKKMVAEVIKVKEQQGKTVSEEELQHLLNEAKNYPPFNVFQDKFDRCGETFEEQESASDCFLNELQKFQEKFNKKILEYNKVNVLCENLDSTQQECSFIKQTLFDSRINRMVDEVIKAKDKQGKTVSSEERQKLLSEAKNYPPFNVFQDKFDRCGETFEEQESAASCLLKELQVFQENFNKEF